MTMKALRNGQLVNGRQKYINSKYAEFMKEHQKHLNINLQK